MKKTNEKIKNGITELVFILDRSGSMGGLESDTIGGFNSLLEKQKKQDGSAFVTTVLFDNELETLHDRVPLEEVKANMRPRVVATSVNNIIEEFFATNEGLDAHVEGRIELVD